MAKEHQTQHEHSTSHKEIKFWESTVLMVSFWFITIFYCKIRQMLLQRLITKCVRCFIVKYYSFIARYDSFYKMRRFYYVFFIMIYKYTFNTHNSQLIIKKFIISIIRLKHTKTRSIQNGVCLVELRILYSNLLIYL